MMNNEDVCSSSGIETETELDQQLIKNLQVEEYRKT